MPLAVQIGGMTCSSCSNAIEQTLADEPGILQLSVALLSGRAEVIFTCRLPIFFLPAFLHGIHVAPRMTL